MEKKNKQSLANFSMADKVENYGYMRKFTPEELTEMKNNLTEKLIFISGKEEELSAIKESFKNELKMPKEQTSALIKNLKNKSEYVNEPCGFEFDYEKRIAKIYNSDGEHVGTRPLSEDEMQMTTMSILRKDGTNN